MNDVGYLHQKIDDLQQTVNRLSLNLESYMTTQPGQTKSKKGGEDDEGANDFSKDENEERGNWSGRLDFFLACLGYAVGLGNVWRFPYLCYKNGGAVFFIPYIIMLTIVGVPIFLLELALGQYTSSGPLTCWKMAPIFKGVGAGMVLVSLMVGIYYNMIIAWSLYYLFASFTSTLPWSECNTDLDWVQNDTCYHLFPDMPANCSYMNMTYDVGADGLCYEGSVYRGVYDRDLVKNKTNITFTLPSDDYLKHSVWSVPEPASLSNIGTPKWQLVLCLLLAWLIVALSLSNGIKSSGKVVYFTALFPYVVLVILLVRGLTLEGHYEGIRFYLLEPDLSKLKDAQVWKDAAIQIFFSLSASWGGLITLASYNRFHTNVLRDALIVSVSNCLTSFFAGFVIFSFIGFLSVQLSVPISEVADSGVGLAFVIYADAVTRLPISPLWAILFFLMLITLGLDSEFALVETVTTAIMDQLPSSRKYKTVIIFVFAAFMFLLGLPLTCPGGSYVLTLMDNYAGGWNVLVISLCECICVSYVYGVRRFCDDIGVILGNKGCLLSWNVCKWWWIICWTFLTPCGVMFILIFSWVDYSWTEYDDGTFFPRWADIIGWVMSCIVVLTIIIVGIGMLFTVRGSLGERLRQITTYNVEWGPALVKHRQKVKHLPGFVVDPWGEQDDVDHGQIKVEIGHTNLGFD